MSKPSCPQPDRVFPAGALSAEAGQAAYEAICAAVRDAQVGAARRLPGIKVQMDGENDTYPIEAMQIMRFEGENWKLQGDVIEASAEN